MFPFAKGSNLIGPVPFLRDFWVLVSSLFPFYNKFDELAIFKLKKIFK
jgi:hypothetical protein